MLKQGKEMTVSILHLANKTKESISEIVLGYLHKSYSRTEKKKTSEKLRRVERKLILYKSGLGAASLQSQLLIGQAGAWFTKHKPCHMTREVPVCRHASKLLSILVV